MTASHDEIVYTYQTQGSTSATPNCRPTSLSMARVWDETYDPLHIGQHWDIQGCIGFESELMQPQSWSSFVSYPDTQVVTVNEAGPYHITSIKMAGNGADGINIEAYDNNNQRIPYGVLGASAIITAYHRWCHISGDPDQGETPVYGDLVITPIVFYDDIQGLYNQITFGVLGKVGLASKVRYNIPFEWVLVGFNSTLWDFWDDMLNGDYADSEGIAPTGGSGGGGGLYNRPDEDVPIPALPSISVCDTGFISLYRMTTAEMQSLGNFLWSNSFVDNILKNFVSPFDNIISLQMIPFSPAGTSSVIKIGNISTGVSGAKLASSFFEVDCGIKYINEYYKTFADYAPYTQVHLYLPYIGIIDINPDDVMDGGINVVYHIDVFSGSCVAFVRCNSGGAWHVLSQHAGNISSQFPITGANFASVYIGAINAIGAVAGGAAGGAMGVMAGGISGMNSIMNAKPTYERSGGITSVSGIMGIQYPYLIFSTPQYIVAKNFRDVKGHVSNLKCTVSSCSGFLQATADNSELSGIGCTAYELDLIRNLLAEGIYI